MKTNKEALRSCYKDKRFALSQEDCIHYNELLRRQFSLLDISYVKYLHTYLPIIDKKEPDTYNIINWLNRYHPKIKIVVSAIHLDTFHLDTYLFDDKIVLQKNKFGIFEPHQGNRVSINEVDMILVPLLTFDTKGNRVGYGKGIYDRLFTQCKYDIVKVGISFFDPISEIEHINEFDVKLDYCITPETIYSF